MEKVIIYDKDGTLMKFDPFWVPVARHAMRNIFLRTINDEAIAEKLTGRAEKLAGINNDKTDPDGILCSGTYSQLAEIISAVLKDAGYEKVVSKSVVEKAMDDAVKFGKTLPCRENLREKLIEARRFADLFVVTTDEPIITDICLKKLGVEDLFEKIYCDDGNCPHKPDPFAVREIEELTGAARKDIYMVGDTSTDCAFAENAGINFISVGDCAKIKAKAVYNAIDAVDATEFILSRRIVRDSSELCFAANDKRSGLTGKV